MPHDSCAIGAHENGLLTLAENNLLGPMAHEVDSEIFEAIIA